MKKIEGLWVGAAGVASLFLLGALAAGCGGGERPTSKGDGGLGGWADGGGANGGADAGTIPYVLEPTPSAADALALVRRLRVEAEKVVPEEIKSLVSQHAAEHGYSLDAAAFRGSGKPAYGGAEAYELQIEPKDLADLLRMLGYEALFKGNLSVSKWLFLSAAELKPGDPLFLNDAGFALIKSGQLADAKAIVLRALAIDPNLHSLYVNLSNIYRKDAHARNALLAILRAISLQPKVVTYRQLAAEIYLEMGNTASAYRQLEAGIRLDPGNAEIQAQLDALPKPPDGDPPSPPPSALAIMAPVLQCEMDAFAEYAVKIATVSGKEMGVDQTFQNETAQASYDWTDCYNACIALEGCWEMCSMAECSANQAALAKAVGAEVLLPPEAESMYYQMYDFFMGCVTPHLVKETNAQALGAALDEVDRYYSSITYSVHKWYVSSAELMQLWHSDVAGVCEDAEQAIADLDLEKAFQTVNNQAALDLCLDRALCIGINNSNISVSASVGIFTGKLSTDLETGEWAVSAGVGVADPTGTFQTGLSVKFHSTKGVGLSGDVKIGGPVKVRLGGDFYASEALR